MVVHILPAGRKKVSFGQALVSGLSRGVGEGLKLYGEHAKEREKKQKLAEGFKNLESEFADNPEQLKLIRAYSELADYPELAKGIGSQLSQQGQKPLSGLDEARRQQILLENKSMQDEEDFLSKLMGGGRKTSETQPNEAPKDKMDFRSELRGQQEEEGVPGKASQREFDYNDPSTWSDKEINKFRSFEGKSPKAKTFAKMAQNEYDIRQESKKAKTKYQENIVPLEGALETLDRMEKLGKKGNLGIGTSVRGVLSPNARREASEYERLGKSLISFASNIPIRNRQEFETLAHDLYDPSISDASREGILSAMKRIIQSSMKQYQAPEDEGMQEARQPRQAANKERPPLTSFLK